VSVELTGPITPASGDCTAASAWTTASRHTLTATVSDAAAHTDALPGDGTFPYSAPAPAGIGCYRQRVVVTLHDPAGHALAVPADSDSAVFVLRPTVTAAVTQLWTISPQPVLVHVSVDGLFGQPAHVRVRMYSAVADPLGCAHARYRSSASAPLGPSVLVPPGGAQSTVDAQSGPTPAHGCYSVVPEVVLDANPGVTASARPGLDGTTLVAAVPTDGALPPAALHGADTTTLVAFLATGGMTLVLLLGVVALVVRFAWHQRDLVPELGGPPLLLGGSGTD
jgi:hypothetical protein